MKKFSMQRAFAVLLAMAMLVTSLYVPDKAAYAAAKPAKIKSVKLKIGTKNVTKKTYKMTKGKTKKLKVAVKPASSKKKKKAVTYRSKNRKIVSVSKKGQLKAKKVGTTKIIVTVAGKKGARKKTWVKIKVSKKKKGKVPKDETDSGNTGIPDNPSTPSPTVTPSTPDTPSKPSTPSSPSTPGLSGGGSTGYWPTYPSNSSNNEETGTIVSTQQELLAALKRQPSEVTFQTNSDTKVIISGGEFKNTTLIVDAPNATIENAAVYKEIKIKAIATHTWIEKSAIGNRINVVAKKAHIVVADGAKADIEVNEEAEGAEDDRVVTVDNQGTINSFSLSAKATLFIKGNNKQNRIPLTIEENGKDATVNTSVPLDVMAKAAIVLQLHSGAEKHSEIKVSNTDAMPTIVAMLVGYLQVTNRETGRADDVLVTMPSPGDPGFENEPLPKEKGSIKGTVKSIKVEGNGHSEKPLANAAVHVIPYERGILQSDLEAAILAAQKQDKCYKTNTNEDGKYTVQKIPYGNYVIVVKADNLQTYLYTIVLNEESKQMDAITMIPSSAGTGSIEGSITNAFDGELVKEPLKLYLRKGAGTVAGKAEQETEIVDGKYSFKNVPIGVYTIRVVDERPVAEGENYINVAFNVVVLENIAIGQDMAITKAVADEQLRFVLRWGDESDEVPADLDSHLVGPGATENEPFHTYFSQNSYPENNTDSIEAKLDHDETHWKGPETTTIYKKKDGVYHFYVYNFSAWREASTRTLATSQAKVDVYLGGRLLTAYNVPDDAYNVPDEKGTLWDVCTYDTHSEEPTLTPINKIYNYPRELGWDKIGLVDEIKKELNGLIQRYENKAKDYFGEDVEQDVVKKIQEAKTGIESSKEKYGEEEFREVLQRYIELKEYFDKLRASTEISSVEFDGKVKCDVNRVDSTDGHSKIVLQGSNDNFSGDLQFTVAENASYTLGSNDLTTGCPVSVTVANSITKAKEIYDISYKKYEPNLDVWGIMIDGNKNIDWKITKDVTVEGKKADVLSITGSAIQLATTGSAIHFTFASSYDDTEIKWEYTPLDAGVEYVGKLEVAATQFNCERTYYVKYGSLLEPSDIIDGNNEIYSLEVEHKGINGSSENCIYIYGSEKALTTSGPALTFDGGGNEVTSIYTPPQEDGKDGVFTVTYQGTSKVYSVKYQQGPPKIKLLYIWDEKNMMTLSQKPEQYEDHLIYSVTGDQEKLSSDTSFSLNVDAEDVKMEASPDSRWNYKLTIKYKDKDEVIYINYTKK